MNKVDEQHERDRNRRERPSRFTDGKKDRSRERRGKDNRVYVSNIPYDYKWNDVKDLFREKVGDVSYVELFTDENDKPRGCGIVEFSNNESIAKAMEVMHRFSIQGRKLVIKEDFGKIRDKFGHVVKDNSDRPNEPRMMNKSGGSIRMPPENMNQLNTYGLSVQFLDSIGIHGALGSRIFVANLDYKVDRAKLKEVFKMAGKVRNIDLSIDKDGNSRGFAVIEYDHPVEAVQAISMFDGQILFERKLAVRMDRVNDKQEIRLPEGLKGIGVGLGPNGEPFHDIARSLTQNVAVNPDGGMGSGILGAGPSAVGAGFGNSMGAQGVTLPAIGSFLNQGNVPGNLMGMNKNDFGSTSGMRGNMDLGNSSQNGFNGGGSMGGGMNRLGSSQNSQNYPYQSNMHRDNMGNANTYNNMNMGRTSPNMFGSQNSGNMNTVQITNLPPSMTWQLIREKFSEVGNIQFANKTGVDKAVVRYQNEWGAENAIKKRLIEHALTEGPSKFAIIKSTTKYDR